MDELTRISQLHLQGFHCAQVLLIMGLEHQGKEDPDLIRAMNGLSGGLGFQGKTCGALAGGACLLESIAFETVAKTTVWERVFTSLAPVSTPLLYVVGLLIGAAIVWFSWKASPVRKLAAAAV